MSDEKVRVNWTLDQLNEILVLLDEIDPLTTGNDRKLRAIREAVWGLISDIKKIAYGDNYRDLDGRG